MPFRDPFEVRSMRQTYAIAHTARCKLQLAADRPDRDLRFILGHAFTLDKLRLRIAEIEYSGSSSSGSDSDSESEPEIANNPVCTNGLEHGHGNGGGGMSARPMERRVSFQGNGPLRVPTENAAARRRSPPPPPPQLVEEDDDDTDSDDEEVDDDDDEEEGLGLQRFGSGNSGPVAPKIVDDDEVGVVHVGEDGVEFEGVKYSAEEVRRLCAGQGDRGLVDAYKRVVGCPCHGERGPGVENLWEVKGLEGEKEGRRVVVMQVV